jgi:leucyl-tRNA---protein transferase
MRELIRIVEEHRECSYLPQETAALEIRAITDINSNEYGELLSRGYRRFGWQLFRPACPCCIQCRSLRVSVQQFVLSGSQRRILRQNEGVRVDLYPLFATPEHIELYNLYHAFMHEHRGWPLREATKVSYCEEFLSGAIHLGRQWLYFEDDRLVGVALMDEAPGAISLIYCFYHPDWRTRSPGSFSILNQLLYAKENNLEYAYLGYWIEACPSMSYKARFQPHQILERYPADDEPAVWR